MQPDLIGGLAYLPWAAFCQCWLISRLTGRSVAGSIWPALVSNAVTVGLVAVALPALVSRAAQLLRRYVDVSSFYYRPLDIPLAAIPIVVHYSLFSICAAAAQIFILSRFFLLNASRRYFAILVAINAFTLIAFNYGRMIFVFVEQLESRNLAIASAGSVGLLLLLAAFALWWPVRQLVDATWKERIAPALSASLCLLVPYLLTPASGALIAVSSWNFESIMSYLIPVLVVFSQVVLFTGVYRSRVRLKLLVSIACLDLAAVEVTGRLAALFWH